MMAAQARSQPVRVEKPEEWGVAEVADYLDVSPDYVYAQARKIPGAFKFAKKWRFHPAKVRAWYESQRKGE